MSATKHPAAPLSGISTLWIDSTVRAFAFVAALLIVGAMIIAVEHLPAWRILDYAEPRHVADDVEKASLNVDHALSSGQQTVLLVGGSTSRELTRPSRYISEQLTRRCRRQIRFVNAGTSSQSFAESWTLADVLPAARLELLIVGMNYFRFEEPPTSIPADLQAGRIVFSPPESLQQSVASEFGHEDAFDAIRPRQLGWLLNHASAFHWSLHRTDEQGSAEASDAGSDYYDQPARSLAEKQAIAGRYLAARLTMFEHNRSQWLQQWLAFARHEQQRGVRQLYLSLPESRVMAPVDAIIGTQYEALLTSLLETGATVADWRSSLNVPEDAFFDQQHLRAPGRIMVESLLIDQIARLIPNCN